MAAIWAATNGYLDKLEVNEVPRFHSELVEYLRAEGTVLKTIRESGDLSDETAEALKSNVETFAEGFQPRARRGGAAGGGAAAS